MCTPKKQLLVPVVTIFVLKMGEAVVSGKNNPHNAYKLANNQCPLMVKVTAYIPGYTSYILPSSYL